MFVTRGSVPRQRMTGSSPRTEERFGDVGGLRLLGVNIVTLAPNERSAQRHWHSTSEEFVMVLGGIATVVENDRQTQIGPGDIALWRAGDATAHQFPNQSDRPLRYLCVGTNPPHETVRYPDASETLFWTQPHWHVITDDGRSSRSGTEA